VTGVSATVSRRFAGLYELVERTTPAGPEDVKSSALIFSILQFGLQAHVHGALQWNRECSVEICMFHTLNTLHGRAACFRVGIHAVM
jgi:hypothetical protein